MVTVTTIKSPDTIFPPAISMCIRMYNFNQLPKDKCSRTSHKIYPYCTANDYPLNDLINKYSGNLAEHLQFYDLEQDNFADKNDTMNRHFQEQTLQYYFSGHKCIRIPTSIGIDIMMNRTHDTSRTQYDRRTLEHNLDDILLIQFTLDIVSSIETDLVSNSSINIAIFFHEHSKLGHNRDSPIGRYYWEPVIPGRKGEPNVARMNYHQVTTKYMRHPYEHGCIDYNDSSSSSSKIFESKGDCQEKCTRDGILEKYGNVGRVVSTTIFDDSVPYDAPTFNQDIDFNCMKKCRVDCNTIQYNPMLGFLWTNYARPHVFRVQLLSSYPETFITFSAKFDILSYLIFMGGIFGMWVGLDLLTTTSAAINYLTKIFKKLYNLD